MNISNYIAKTKHSLACPIPLRVSPIESQLRVHLLQWATARGLVKGDDGMQRFASYLTERAIGCSMPTCGITIADPLCRFTGWLIITDDYYDEDATGSNLTLIEHAFNRFSKIVNRQTVPNLTELELPIFAMKFTL